MNATTNRQWVLKTRPEKAVEDHHFELKEVAIPELKDGEILIRVLYTAFEPAQRGWLNDVPSYVPPVQIGEVMRAAGVGEVVQSNNPQFQIGDKVQGMLGWQQYTVTTAAGPFPLSKIPAGVPITYPLHVFGFTGMTAYFGLLKIGQPKAGDTVVISGAAGATGSVAGQIAKLKGCKVIGIAGGAKKCEWLMEQANFDAAIDYKNQDVAKQLEQLCKNQINVFFDNVGGAILDDVLMNMAQKGRIVLCGAISSGYQLGSAPGPKNYMQLVIRRCRMEGFLVLDYLAEFPSAIQEMAGWLSEGKIHVEEDVIEGLEQCPAALRGLFEGKNFGKQLVKIV